MLDDCVDSAAAPANRGKPLVRPKDVANWKRDDYYSAKRDGDPRLADAVAWLGERFAGKQSAAELLTRLLEWGVDDPFAENASQRVPASDPKLTEAIVAALAANGTPLARETLERLVAGKLETADKQVAAAAALKRLAGRPGREGEEALFCAAVAPRIAGSASQGRNTATEFRATTIELIKSSASEALRVRLARHATEAGTPQALCDELWDCLKEPRTENLAAQIVFYQSNRLDEKATESLEEQFALQNTAVLARLLGFQSRRDSQADSTAAVADPERAVGLLWNGDLTAVVAARLRRIEELTQSGPLLRLAATMPNQPMRVAMLQTLDKHWEEGPRGLETLVASDGALQEPGFLLVVKKLPRKDPPPAGRSAKSARTVAGGDAKRRQDEVSQQWMTFCESLVRATCQRFCAAALTPSAVANRNDATADLPLKLPANVEIDGLLPRRLARGAQRQAGRCGGFAPAGSLSPHRAESPARQAPGVLSRPIGQLQRTRQPERLLARRFWHRQAAGRSAFRRRANHEAEQRYSHRSQRGAAVDSGDSFHRNQKCGPRPARRGLPARNVRNSEKMGAGSEPVHGSPVQKGHPARCLSPCFPQNGGCMSLIEEIDNVQEAGLCCPRCETGNLPQRKFCAKCGATLWEAVSQLRHALCRGRKLLRCVRGVSERRRGRADRTHRGRSPRGSRDGVGLPLRGSHCPLDAHQQERTPAPGRVCGSGTRTRQPAGRRTSAAPDCRRRSVPNAPCSVLPLPTTTAPRDSSRRFRRRCKTTTCGSCAAKIAEQRQELAALSRGTARRRAAESPARTVAAHRTLAGLEARSRLCQERGRASAEAAGRRREEDAGGASLRPGIESLGPDFRLVGRVELPTTLSAGGGIGVAGLGLAQCAGGR